MPFSTATSPVVLSASLKLYKENKDIEVSLESLKEKMMDNLEIYDEFVDTINPLIIEGLSKEKQYEFLTHYLKTVRAPKTRYTNAVQVISEPVYLENKHIFVISFAQGQFPTSKKDEEYLSYDELKAINRLNIKEKTKIDMSLLTTYFKSDNKIHFSYHKKCLSNKYVVSPIKDMLSLKIIRKELSDIFYSERIAKYIYADLLDAQFYYKETNNNYFKLKDVIKIDYNDYDNAFKGEAKIYNQNSELILSTSQLDLYNSCHYKYYLSNVLKLDIDFDNFNVNLGNFSHHILQACYDEKFDFERQFEEELAKYIFKNDELFVMNNYIKYQLIDAIEALKTRKQYWKKGKDYFEKSFTVSLDDKTLVTGRIDALEIYDNAFICIDYKTGNKTFEEEKLPYGQSTQLPTYAYLLSSQEKYKDYRVAGLYIQNIILNSYSDKVDEVQRIKDHLKLHGRTNDDVNLISEIDPTVLEGSSSFISGLTYKDDGTFRKVKSVVSDEVFNNYILTVKNLFTDMANNLRNNNFKIEPVQFGSNSKSLACSYCPYRDICYKKASQIKIIDTSEETQDGE